VVSLKPQKNINAKLKLIPNVFEILNPNIYSGLVNAVGSGSGSRRAQGSITKVIIERMTVLFRNVLFIGPKLFQATKTSTLLKLNVSADYSQNSLLLKATFSAARIRL
jgi:hypothetical protein